MTTTSPLASVDLVNLAIDIEVMNALLLPIVLGLLLMLEAKALPPEWRMRGLRKYSTWGMCLLVIAFGLYMVPRTLGWERWQIGGQATEAVSMA